MKTIPTPRSLARPASAFTLLELIMVLVIIILLAGMILPTGHSRPNISRIKCVNNLKNVGLAYRIFATDNADLFPWQSTNQMGALQIDYFGDPAVYFRMVSNELSTPKLLICPRDTRTEAPDFTSITRSNISYFIGLDSDANFPNSFLAGDRNLTTNGIRLPPGLVRIRTNSLVAWDNTQHQLQGNVTMGDGSVQQLSIPRLNEQLHNTGTAQTTLAIP